MTTVICVSPQTTVLLISWIPLSIFICYAVIEKRDYMPGHDSFQDIAYTSLPQVNAPTEGYSTTWSEKQALIVQNFHLAVAFFVGYFSEFLTLNGVVTTLAFHNSPFDPRNHFVYYACVFMIGECIGRSYISFLAFINVQYTLVITKTWILSVILFSLFNLLTLASWYRFLPNVWIVLLLCFVVGLLAGSLYLNTYLVVTARGQDDEKGKAFSRAFLSVGPSAGVLFAGIVGLGLEPALRTHCLESSQFSEFCFTRSMNGWNQTTSCLRWVSWTLLSSFSAQGSRWRRWSKKIFTPELLKREEFPSSNESNETYIEGLNWACDQLAITLRYRWNYTPG